MDDPETSAAPELTVETVSYDEQRFPARPRALRMWARRRPRGVPDQESLQGPAAADNPRYVEWLEKQSMLWDAHVLARQVSGRGGMWQNPFGQPDPRAAVEVAPAWFTAYPLSFMTRPGESFLAGLGDPDLWEALSAIGIRAVHTGPVKRAGGIRGWDYTPSVDGHFDRISMEIDPAFGTFDEFRRLCEVAHERFAVVIDDIVPGHTGKGADFRLAEMGHGDYPGIYHMVEVLPEHWPLLPEVPEGRDAANLDREAERALKQAGYIIGELQRVIFYAPGVKETNWTATAPVTGTDGVQRRWVYLHYFKMGQPSVNWLDPTCSGMRLVLGDAVHSLTDIGTGGLRLDANGFLGAEKSVSEGPGWSEGHPLSEAANHLIASMVRKLGGFTFQELNLSIDDIKVTGETGADLSYDFVTRPGYHHALATGDTEFLRLAYREAARVGVDIASLVHALQNHDELTYELVHFASAHHDDVYPFRGQELTGTQLVDAVRGDLLHHLTGERAPYNLVFTTNGIACTTASVIAASLGFTSLQDLTEEQVERITRAHLLLATFNAWQPGVFALSGWDLLGMLPLPAEEVADLLREGDTRWISRAAHDLMGVTSARASSSGLPRGHGLYGSLPDQLADPASFASQLRQVLRLRDEIGIAAARQVDIPDVSQPGMLVLVHRLPTGAGQLTVLNFSPEPVIGSVRSLELPPGHRLVDVLSREEVAVVDQLHTFVVSLEGHTGVMLLVEPPAEEPDAR
ncbi:MAG TPA: maltose alpha-D-glucosyltransferase [Dermatophilaceae bacterium]|nr:maltose alpha-D-glucosyltransferase [Dermatophilaceae bacterium]